MSRCSVFTDRDSIPAFVNFVASTVLDFLFFPEVVDCTLPSDSLLLLVRVASNCSMCTKNISILTFSASGVNSLTGMIGNALSSLDS